LPAHLFSPILIAMIALDCMVEHDFMENAHGLLDGFIQVAKLVHFGCMVSLGKTQCGTDGALALLGLRHRG